MMDGNMIAILGAGVSAILGGVGSALGVMYAGKAATGVTSEKPDLFGKLLVIQALPGTQGIYGFLVAVLIMVNTGLLSGTAALTAVQGWQVFWAAIPMALCGLISGICQGKVAASSIFMVGKQPDALGKGITMTALVETYAILALLTSILLLFSIKF